LRIAITPAERYGAEYSLDAQRVLRSQEFARALQFIRQLPDYKPTPLVEMKELASECHVGAVSIKDESQRLPTHSFKVLGPPYALARQLLSRLDRDAEIDSQAAADLIQGRLKDMVSDATTVAATSGNHGRALAWAARHFGCQCRIYMPAATGPLREAEIRRFGATTVRIPGTYDAAVKRAKGDADRHGYILIGDGAQPDSDNLRHILHGYSVLGDELATAASVDSPTHVFVPAGSGTLAAAVTARLGMKMGDKRPNVVVVQPHSADSAYQSTLSGKRRPARGNLQTVMDGLAVGEISGIAWNVLRNGVFACITIGDDAAIQTLRRFARDDSLAIGETGIAAIAAFLLAANDAAAREQLQMDADSRAILVATEGVTDQTIYDQLTASHQTARPNMEL
jgi:diaminopropionate ammonia-lyase